MTEPLRDSNPFINSIKEPQLFIQLNLQNAITLVLCLNKYNADKGTSHENT
jgi:dTDP-D-glucose 4,6-dehydratase